MVRELCARGVDINTGRSSDGVTALISASFNGRLEMVRELCNRGANVNAVMPDYHGTALIGASQGGHLGIVRLLLKRGADMSATDSNGSSAFSLASGPFKAALQALLKF